MFCKTATISSEYQDISVTR